MDRFWSLWASILEPPCLDFGPWGSFLGCFWKHSGSHIWRYLLATVGMHSCLLWLGFPRLAIQYNKCGTHLLPWGSFLFCLCLSRFSSSFKFLQGPSSSSSFKFLAVPCSSFKFLQVPPSSLKFLQVPSSSFKFLQAPSSSFQEVHIQPQKLCQSWEAAVSPLGGLQWN